MGRTGLRRLCAAVLAGVLGVCPGAVDDAPDGPRQQMVVHTIGAADPGALVERVGGEVVARLDAVGVVIATLTARQQAVLGPDVEVVPASSRALLADDDGEEEDEVDDEVTWDPEDDPGSLLGVAVQVGADELWDEGTLGEGIDVAVVDSGVAVGGQLPASAVQAGAAFGPDQPGPDRALSDPLGHGTHVAGIIAGRSVEEEGEDGRWGLAPRSRIISVVAAGPDGTADLGHVLSAIDWVITNQRTDGRNIRVLNLSMAADPADRPTEDILAHAVTLAWDAGIVVVAAAGNDGPGRLASPGYEPRILTVGALDHRGTTSPGDDRPLASSSGTLDGVDRPDLWAPGRSVVAALAPGSAPAQDPDAARVGADMVRGTGTSQATAVVSGAAALLLSDRPELSPDQVAALLHRTAGSLAVDGVTVQRARIDLEAAAEASTPPDVPSPITSVVQGWSAADESTWDTVGGEDPHAGDAGWVGARWVGARWVGARWVGARWVGARWVVTAWE